MNSINPPVAAGLPLPPPPVPSPAQGRASANPGIASVNRSSVPWSVVFSVLAIFISLIGTFGLYFINVNTGSQIKKYEAQIRTLNQEIAQPPLSETSSRLQVINAALSGYLASQDTQYDYASILNTLPQIAPKDMAISNLIVDESGKIRITGRVSSFEAAGKALLSFQAAPFISQIKLENLGLADREKSTQINIDLSADLKKEALRIKSTVSSQTVQSPNQKPTSTPTPFKQTAVQP